MLPTADKAITITGMRLTPSLPLNKLWAASTDLVPRVGCRALLLFYLLIIGYAIHALAANSEFARFLGFDYLAFWAASSLTLAGEPLAAFDTARLQQAAQTAIPQFDKTLFWHYPPPFQLLVMPAALLPYPVSAAIWLLSTFLAYLLALRGLQLRLNWLLPALAFPGVIINLKYGQNGFLTAALLAGALALLRKQPVVAGILIGLLICKPHLGVLIPVALICARQWKTLIVAGTTAVGLVAISTVILGPHSWAAFLQAIPQAGERLDNGFLKWPMIPSVYVGLRTAGLDAGIAYAVHAGVALAVTMAVAWVWLRRVPFELAAAVLVCGAVLVPPYIFDYDLVLLAVPILILLADGARRGWLMGDRAVLVLAWFAPLGGLLDLHRYGISIAPLCLIALCAVAVRRAAAFADHYGMREYDRRLFPEPGQPAVLESKP